jgi:hypothetical protein
MNKKPTDRVTTLEKPNMLKNRGEVVPAAKVPGRQFTLSEAVKAFTGSKPREHEPQVAEITPKGVVITSAHKATRKHMAEPEPIIVVTKPVAIHTDHKGVSTEKPGPDYRVVN